MGTRRCRDVACASPTALQTTIFMILFDSVESNKTDDEREYVDFDFTYRTCLSQPAARIPQNPNSFLDGTLPTGPEDSTFRRSKTQCCQGVLTFLRLMTALTTTVTRSNASAIQTQAATRCTTCIYLCWTLNEQKEKMLTERKTYIASRMDRQPVSQSVGRSVGPSAGQLVSQERTIKMLAECWVLPVNGNFWADPLRKRPTLLDKNGTSRRWTHRPSTSSGSGVDVGGDRLSTVIKHCLIV